MEEWYTVENNNFVIKDVDSAECLNFVKNFLKNLKEETTLNTIKNPTEKSK